ncbi:DUF3558 family protein, partial [Saccharopolyspora sp. MS10]|uniref:DUF3558 family protein n=1 Tax=Saccharopolyspora sp. MS10 TaxID=3385973 RepID=UPI0039A130C9
MTGAGGFAAAKAGLAAIGAQTACRRAERRRSQARDPVIKFFRYSSVMVAVMSVLGISSCALGGSTGGAPDFPGSNSAEQGAGLNKLDPCAFFRQDELMSYGVGTQPEEFTQVSFQPGCAWNGEKMDVAMQKNADETVDSLASGGPYDEYTKIEVAGRPAARMLVSGAAGEGSCITVVSAGGGVVLYQLVGRMRDSVADPCGEIEKIAG